MTGEGICRRLERLEAQAAPASEPQGIKFEYFDSFGKLLVRVLHDRPPGSSSCANIAASEAPLIGSKFARRLERLESMIELPDAPTEFDIHTLNFVGPDMTVTRSITLQFPRPPRTLNGRVKRGQRFGRLRTR